MTTNYPASFIKLTFEISLPSQQIPKLCSNISLSQNLIGARGGGGGARFGIVHVLDKEKGAQEQSRMEGWKKAASSLSLVHLMKL